MPYIDPETEDAGTKGVMVSMIVPLVGAAVGIYFTLQGRTKAKALLSDDNAGTPLAMKRVQKCTLVTFMLIGACALYGFLGAMVIHVDLNKSTYFVPGFAGLSAGYIIGMGCCCSAVGIGMVGAVGVEKTAQQPRIFVGFILVLIYIEATGLYSLIAGLVCMMRARKASADLDSGAVMPFAMVSILASLGTTIGSTASGIAVMEIGVMRPDLIMKSILSVVISGVLGIFGLVSVVTAAKHWPPDGGASLAGLLYLIAGVSLAYFGYHGVKSLEDNPNSFTSMLTKLLSCNMIGFFGLIISLIMVPAKTRDSRYDGFDDRYDRMVALGAFPREISAIDAQYLLVILVIFFVPVLIGLIFESRQQVSAGSAPLLG